MAIDMTGPRVKLRCSSGCGIVLAIVAVLVAPAACGDADRGGTQLAATEPAPLPPLAITDGASLVEAMYRAYEGRWYETSYLVQEVVYHEEGEPARSEVWTELLWLPGRVRGNIGPVEDGNAEIYTDGAFHTFRDGELVRTGELVHTVLLLGFDVYMQEPDVSVAQLERAGVDMALLREDTWQGRPVWVVGAEEGDVAASQFWIDQENLVFVRQIMNRPDRGLLEVEMNAIEPLGKGWIATELVFRRGERILLTESYLEWGILDAIDPAVFDVDDLVTDRLGAELPE